MRQEVGFDLKANSQVFSQSVSGASRRVRTLETHLRRVADEAGRATAALNGFSAAGGAVAVGVGRATNAAHACSNATARLRTNLRAVASVAVGVGRTLAGAFSTVGRALLVVPRAIGHVIGWLDRMKWVGILAFGALTAAVVKFGQAAGSAFAEREAQFEGLVNLMGGNRAAAGGAMSQIKELSRLPGLDVQESLHGFNQLMSVGLKVPLALRLVKEFGNAVAIAGGGTREFALAIRGLSQMFGKGKISAEELNQQILEQAPLIRQAMLGVFKTSEALDITRMLGSKSLQTNEIRQKRAALKALVDEAERLRRAQLAKRRSHGAPDDPETRMHRDDLRLAIKAAKADLKRLEAATLKAAGPGIVHTFWQRVVAQMEKLPRAADLVKNALENIAIAWKENLIVFGEGLFGGHGAKFFNTIVGWLDQLREGFRNAGKAVREALSDLFAGVDFSGGVNRLQAWLEGLDGHAIAARLQAGWAKVVELFTRAKRAIEPTVKMLRDFWAALLGGLKDAPPGVDKLTAALKRLGATLLDTLPKLVPVIRQIASDIAGVAASLTNLLSKALELLAKLPPKTGARVVESLFLLAWASVGPWAGAAGADWRRGEEAGLRSSDCLRKSAHLRSAVGRRWAGESPLRLEGPTTSSTRLARWPRGSHRRAAVAGSPLCGRA